MSGSVDSFGVVSESELRKDKKDDSVLSSPQPTKELENKPIEIRRVESNEGIVSTSEVLKDKKEGVALSKPEPTKPLRKERSDKGKERKNVVKHIKKGVRNENIKKKTVPSNTSIVNKPKSNVGFKIGVGLGIIAGIFGAVFIYNYIKNKYLKTKVEVHEESEDKEPITEQERINSLYSNDVKSD